MSTNSNFAETLASVASEFGVESAEKPGRGIKPSKRPYFKWTEEQLEQLATLRDEGKSASEIAEALGVSRDKVVTKLAAMAARERAKPEPTEQSAESEPRTEPEPELNPVSQDLNPTAVDLDRMIFTAFDSVVGKVDDFVTMSRCWRKVLTVIEQEIRKLSYIIEQHPNTEESVCQIAAIIAYDQIAAVIAYDEIRA